MIIIKPDGFGPGAVAFFTGMTPGVDLDAVAGFAGVTPEDIYMPIQEHTDRVLVLGEQDAPWEPEVADAVVTKQTGVLLGVKTADCVPVLLYSQAGGAIAAVHAGWKGTAAGIVKKTIQEMRRLEADGIAMAIGPSIRQCCYEVGPDVADAVAKETGPGGYHEKKGGRLFLDLAAANRAQAVSLGIGPGSIWMSTQCTVCGPGRFHSFRRDQEAAGRQGAFIGMIENY